MKCDSPGSTAVSAGTNRVRLQPHLLLDQDCSVALPAQASPCQNTEQDVRRLTNPSWCQLSPWCCVCHAGEGQWCPESSCTASLVLLPAQLWGAAAAPAGGLPCPRGAWGSSRDVCTTRPLRMERYWFPVPVLTQAAVDTEILSPRWNVSDNLSYATVTERTDLRIWLRRLKIFRH